MKEKMREKIKGKIKASRENEEREMKRGEKRLFFEKCLRTPKSAR